MRFLGPQTVNFSISESPTFFSNVRCQNIPLLTGVLCSGSLPPFCALGPTVYSHLLSTCPPQPASLPVVYNPLIPLSETFPGHCPIPSFLTANARSPHFLSPLSCLPLEKAFSPINNYSCRTLYKVCPQ